MLSTEIWASSVSIFWELEGTGKPRIEHISVRLKERERSGNVSTPLRMLSVPASSCQFYTREMSDAFRQRSGAGSWEMRRILKWQGLRGPRRDDDNGALGLRR